MYCLEVIFRDQNVAPEYFEIETRRDYVLNNGILFINPVEEGRIKEFPRDVIFSVECYKKEVDE